MRSVRSACVCGVHTKTTMLMRVKTGMQAATFWRFLFGSYRCCHGLSRVVRWKCEASQAWQVACYNAAQCHLALSACHLVRHPVELWLVWVWHSE